MNLHEESLRRVHRAQKLAHSLEEPGVHARRSGQYIGDLVYGATDGIVTTFAVVSGVAGASLSPGIVLIMGFANLFADGLSMAVGNYLASKSELEYQERERAREEWEIDHLPDVEREEVRQIFERKGFTGELLDRAVAVITQDRERWIETMMLEELHFISEQNTNSPVMAGIMTFIAFVVAGFVPLLSYLLSHVIPFFAVYAYPAAVTLTFIAIFAVGATRVCLTGKRWWISGLEMLLVGGATAVVAYLIGYALKGLAG